MASGSNNLTTYYAKRIIGDTNAQSSMTALLQTGTGIATDLWILGNTVHDTYGIRYSYDGDNSHDKLQAWGGGNAATAWVQLDTGDVYILGKVGIGYDPNTSGNTHKLYVNGTGYFSNSLITASGLHAAFIELSYTTPYIDFHFDNSTADNTSRIIETSAGYLQIPGSFGVGGQNTSYKFYVNGTSYLKGDTTIVGNVSFGASNTSNYISIHGLTGDAADTQWANHYFIGNRHWANSESSELVLFSGNDVGNGNSATTVSGSGPDRIRYIGAAHLFQTYSAALSGTFETVCTSSSLVNIFEINTNNLTGYKRMILQENNSWLSPARLQLLRPDTTAYTDRACVGVTDGNLHIDPYPNKGLYLNYYNSGGNVYFNGSTYYINGGNYNGNATTCTYPLGFASRSTGVTWGNTTGTTITSWNDSSGGSCDWRMNNPSSGKMSLKVDGRFYGNEGTYPAMLMKYENNYWGMGTPDAGNDWIRTTTQGIIPSQSGGAGSGHCGLGTSSWYFSYVYADNFYGYFNGNVSGSSSSCTGNAATATSSPRLSSSGYQDTCLSYLQTPNAFDGNSGWCHYIICNHGAGSTYYHYTIGLPFWDVPKYKRQTGSTSSVSGWHTFITSENIGSQSVKYATSAGSAATAGSVAWGNTGHPSTFPPSAHAHTVGDIVWKNGQNLTCTGGGEWSVDLSGDGYWHVWSGHNSKSILACYNNNLKVVMNGVLYVQEICAIDGNGMLMYNNSGSAYWTGGNTYNWGVGATNLPGFVRSNNNPVRHWRQGANYYFTESSSSSRLVKTNIVDMPEELAKNLLKLEVKSFDYREGYGLKGQFGMIAEDVEPIFPVVIDEVDSAVEPELPTIKMIDYLKFVPFLVKMIQIQQKEIDELKQQILKCD